MSRHSTNWKNCKLGDVIQLKRGYDLPKQDRRVGKVPIISSSGASDFHDEAKVKGPGVVTGRYGTIGQVYYITDDYWPLNTTLYVEDFKGNHPRFIAYFLSTLDFQAYSDKAAVPGVNRNHLHEAKVSIPTKEEQERIATILGSLDNKIELNRRMNATLESMAQAIFKSWFIDFDPVHRNAAACSGQSYESIAAAILQSETFDNLFPGSFSESKLGLIPSGWSITAISDFVELQRGKTYKSRLKDLPGPYLLGLGSIERNGGFRSDKLATYGGDSPDNLLVNPGDLYVSLKDVTQSADLLGAVARFPKQLKLGRLTQDTVKLILMPDTVSPSILYHFLLLPEYREYCRSHATGTTNLGLAREDFLSYLVVKPSKNVQGAFDEITNQIDDRIEKNDTESQALTVLRDELLSQLLCECLRRHSTQNPTLANH